MFKLNYFIMSLGKIKGTELTFETLAFVLLDHNNNLDFTLVIFYNKYKVYLWSPVLILMATNTGSHVQFLEIIQHKTV